MTRQQQSKLWAEIGYRSYRWIVDIRESASDMSGSHTVCFDTYSTRESAEAAARKLGVADIRER